MVLVPTVIVLSGIVSIGMCWFAVRAFHSRSPVRKELGWFGIILSVVFGSNALWSVDKVFLLHHTPQLEKLYHYTLILLLLTAMAVLVTAISRGRREP